MNTALLVVDVQKVYTFADSELSCPGAQATVNNVNRLVEHFEHAGSPVFFIRHIHKTDGSDLGRMFDYAGEPEEEFNFKEGSEEVQFDDALRRPAGAVEIVKTRYSAFVGTDLDGALRENDINRVVICGFMTNFCCESTARDAHDRDYFVDFVIDATGTPGTESMEQEQIRSIVAEFLDEGFACTMTTDEYLKQH